QSGSATMIPSSQIFASPLLFDGDWNPQPYLAKSWKVADDGLSVTLNLVKGATFHDGKPITSADVAFSIMTIKANHPFKSMMEPVAEVQTPDPHTAILKLSKPHPAILLSLSQALCPIIPKHIFGDGQDLKTHPMNLKPIGSGPFKFVEYKAGEHLILEGYDNFFLGAPKLDKIVIKIIRDAVNRAVSLERKEVSMHLQANVALDITRAQKLDHVKVEPTGKAVSPLQWIAFNTKRGPFEDKRVRKAIAYALDREFITKRLWKGLAETATGPIFPGTPYYSADVELYKANLDKAGSLLDAAGYKKGADGKRFSTVIDYIPAGPEWKATAEYMRTVFKKVGIEAKVRTSADFPAWIKQISSWDFDMTIDSVWGWGDPVIGVHRTYLTSNIRQGVIWSNTQQYSNPKVDDLLAKAAVEMDQAKREALYAEFQKIVVDDVPIYYYGTFPFYVIYDKKLKNVNTTIWGPLSPMHEVEWE
ncbi:MAG: ABC transporter substrate-binding protein, partial [Thermodesulfobacteriota bacterium]